MRIMLTIIIHEIGKTNGIDDQAEEAEWEAEKYSGEDGIPQPHVQQIGLELVVEAVGPDSNCVASLSLQKSIKFHRN